jgi:hypothetical protein
MKLEFTTLLGAALLCGSLAVHAQAPGGPGQGPGGERRFRPCSQEADPAKCEAKRKEMREQFQAMRDACKDKPDRRACMAEKYCAKAPDPAQCQARAKEREARENRRLDEHQAAAEACSGKRGDELRKCYRDQREKSGRGRPDRKG